MQELQSRLQSCYEVARSNLRINKERSKEYSDRNTNVPLFAVGENVLLHDEHVRLGRSVKLCQPYIISYEVISIDDVNITLRLPRKRTVKFHANRLKPFFGWLTEIIPKLWFAELVSAIYSKALALDVTVQQFEEYLDCITIMSEK